jgi:hypothetical protein
MGDLPDPEVIQPPPPAAAAAAAEGGAAARTLSQHSRSTSAKLGKQSSTLLAGADSAAVAAIGADAAAVGGGGVEAAVHAGGEEGEESVQVGQDQAATKVQAAFRGHQARKRVAAMKGEGAA